MRKCVVRWVSGAEWSGLGASCLRRTAVASVLALAALSGLPGGALPSLRAQSELRVCPSGCDYTTVQAAVDAATAGDVVSIATGEYKGVTTRNGLTQHVYIDKAVILRGGYNADFTARDPSLYPTVLNADAGGRVVYLSGAVRVTIDGLQMINGRAGRGAGVSTSGATLRVLRSRIADNRGVYSNAGQQGIGLDVSGGSLYLQDTVVQGNQPLSTGMTFYGAGLNAQGASIELRNSQFLGNVATSIGSGGGANIENCTVIVDGTTFRGNSAGGNGGGGLFTRFGTLRLANSTFDANTGDGATIFTNGAEITGNTMTANIGVGLALGTWSSAGIQNAIVSGNTMKDNTSTGFCVRQQSAESLLVENNRFIGNKGSGVVLTARSDMGTATAVVLRRNSFQANSSSDAGGGAVLNGAVDVLFNEFVGNTAARVGGAIYQAETGPHNNASAVYDGNRFRGNSAPEGGALYIKPTYSDLFNLSYRNMVFLDNTATTTGSAIYYYVYASPVRTWSHLTLSGNHGGDGAAIFVMMGKSTWSNSIIHNSPVGFAVHSNWGVTLDHVLRSAVTTPTVGAPTETSPLSGNPAFQADGYHLSWNSAALDAGSASGVIDDVDGNPRPMGTAPDVGADESPYSSAARGVQASMQASVPEWKVYYTGVNVPPSTYLEQTYLLPYAYYAPAGASAVANFSIRDELPAGLRPTTVTSTPTLDTTTVGQAVAWTSRGALTPEGWGWVGVTNRSDTAVGGQSLVNNGQVDYTTVDGVAGSIALAATTTVPTRPVFPPVLTTPLDGEMCLDPNQQLTARGVAGAGMTVKLFEDSVLKVQTVADATTGEFAVTWTSGLSDDHSVSLTTQACETGGNCSVVSRSVVLEHAEADWCAQRSYWEGDVHGNHYRFYFRDDRGRYATNDFVIPGVAGFWNTKVHMYSCCDENDVNPFKVKADGVVYETPSAHDGRWWTFDIAGAHTVTVESQCQGIGGTTKPKKVTTGEVLIDPDGFIFDSTHGGSYDTSTGLFSPVQPLTGMTVTAYQYVEDWGTWVVWPAAKYGQINPQVTGTSGYFAFFTPPGKYFLQVDAANGYQSWRSPVVTVVADLVHVNVPLTALATGATATVSLTPDGPSPQVLEIPVGASVKWVPVLRDGASATDLATLNATPTSQPRTSSPLEPLTNPLGFDGGMLKPGQEFRRPFTTVGEYIYSDGLGHTGTIKVTSAAVQPAPTVTAIYPARGTPLGGAPVTITGADFAAGATVTFGGVQAQAVSVKSGTTIVALIPAHAAGTVSVTVANPDEQSGTLANGFEFVAGLPTFMDDPLRPGVTRVKAAHVTELRQRIDALRARDGLPTYAWTDATIVAGSTIAKASHLVELRTALNEVYQHESRLTPTYTGPTPTVGTVLAAIQLAEVRAAIVSIW